MGQLYVVIRHNSILEQLHQLDAAGEVIGRSRECGIWLPNEAVSRRHAAILKQGNRFAIRDERSRNGTYLNGKVISSEEILDDEAVVNIGPYTLTMCYSIAGAIKHTANVTDESTQSHTLLFDAVGSIGKEKGRLTAAQFRVYELFLEGYSEKQIATQLRISANTVHGHAKAIYKRLAVSTRSELLSRRIGQRYPD
jgi:pSer/pThr/pTyr-binding forkhead associated (FHA) protein